MTSAGGELRSRGALDAGVDRLRHDIADLAERVTIAIERSIDSLARLDPELAETVIEEDRLTNELRFAIEDRVVSTVATQQPIAADLRFCIAALSVATELERMGDYCVGIARVTLLHEGRRLLKPLIDIPRMSRLVRSMLADAVDAFLAVDALAAQQVARRDDEVDQLYDQVYRELLTYVMVDRANIERATWLLWVAHDLERVGDRIQNICERTIYEATGVMTEFSSADA